MNIVLYGVPDEVTARVAERYDLNPVGADDASGHTRMLLSVSPTKDPERLLALYETICSQADRIDAVILCGFESCAAASTVQYCAPVGKLFTLNKDAGEEALEEELSQILDTLAGNLCAHEGL